MQIFKIAVAPTVVLLELLMFKRLPPPRIIASVLVVCSGVFLATTNDTQVCQLGVGCPAI
jgi:solute carrier family 35 protein E3